MSSAVPKRSSRPSHDPSEPQAESTLASKLSARREGYVAPRLRANDDQPPDEESRIDAERACAIARATVDALAGLDTKPVRTLIAPTPRGLQRRRQIAMYLAHTALGTRASDVARKFGRDTTTAYHAFRQIEDLRDDPDIDGFLDGMDALLVALTERDETE